FNVERKGTHRGLLITIYKDVIDERYINTLLSAYNHQAHLLRNKETDSLTGLLNRQSFDARLSKLHDSFACANRCDDQHCSYTFALLDIDFFKKVNDKYGHVYGDEVLILFANLMKKTFRDSDMLFRYGGEEFAVLLHDVNPVLADSILNRFRNTVADFNFPMDNKVTTSIGFSEFTNKIPVSSIVEHADKALYYAKENGRNKTTGFEQLLAENKIQDSVVHNDDIELF
ncbi:MAG: GGDEF domain-containing protein, partial [Gammaproteobacteria bacterium]|nr:GGDEF domain-containing protein [Gammaproteobacteria bacterium]